MEKIIFLADLHGNMTATLAMEQQIEQIHPDEVWFLGDAVGKGPENDKTCDWVRGHCTHFVRGNWDDRIEKHKELADCQSDFYLKQLGMERATWLESLPLEDSVWISGIHFRLIHGRPLDRCFFGEMSEEELTQGIRSSDTKKAYSGLICADSHRPFIRTLKAGYAINTGSVGNGIGQPLAHALLVEGELGSRQKGLLRMTILSVPYDNARAAAIAQECPGLPNKEAYCREVMTGIYSR